MNAEGLCKCGCGQKTKLAYRNDKERGWVKGQPLDYINGHFWRNNKYPDKAKQALSAKYRERVKSPQDHPSWQGGIRICRGYVYVMAKGNSNAERSGYVKRCVLAMQGMIGRHLKKGEMVHHRDGDKQNDEPANLLLCTKAEHNKIHAEIKNEHV